MWGKVLKSEMVQTGSETEVISFLFDLWYLVKGKVILAKFQIIKRHFLSKEKKHTYTHWVVSGNCPLYKQIMANTRNKKILSCKWIGIEKHFIIRNNNHWKAFYHGGNINTAKITLKLCGFLSKQSSCEMKRQKLSKNRWNEAIVIGIGIWIYKIYK